MDFFSQEWADALCEQLNQNQAYQASAQTWEGSLLLVAYRFADDTQNPAILLDLWHGQCRSARLCNGAAHNEAEYVLSAKPTDWQTVLNGDIAPLMAVMRGKLRLLKGSTTTLARYANAAKQIVVSAADVGAAIPEEWLG